MAQRPCFEEFTWWLPFIFVSLLCIILPIVFGSTWYIVIIIYVSICLFFVFLFKLQFKFYNYGWFPAYVESKRTLEGQWCIVTGANSGSGFETAKELVRRGCNTIITCRSQSKIDATIERITRELNNEGKKLNVSFGKIEGVLLDLCSKKSIDNAINTILSKNVDISILVNNAGAWLTKTRITEDNIEAQWQANYLSPFYFTKKLLPNIKETAKKLQYGRIVNVASIAHQAASVEHFDAFLDASKRGDIEYWKEQASMNVYGDTKCAQMLHAQKLQELFNDENIGNYLYITSLQPGFINSNFVNLSERPCWIRPLFLIFYPFTLIAMITPKQGAQTSLHCVLSDDNIKPGGYHSHCSPQDTKSQADPVLTTKKDKLYQVSDELWNEDV